MLGLVHGVGACDVHVANFAGERCPFSSPV
jgi:hypothetical protein